MNTDITPTKPMMEDYARHILPARTFAFHLCKELGTTYYGKFAEQFADKVNETMADLGYPFSVTKRAVLLQMQEDNWHQPHSTRFAIARTIEHEYPRVWIGDGMGLKYANGDDFLFSISSRKYAPHGAFRDDYPYKDQYEVLSGWIHPSRATTDSQRAFQDECDKPTLRSLARFVCPDDNLNNAVVSLHKHVWQMPKRKAKEGTLDHRMLTALGVTP